MKVIVTKSALAGNVTIPGSKSHTIRGLVISSLAYGKSRLFNPLVSKDTLACVAACRSGIGAEIDTSNNDVWEIMGTNGQLQPRNKTIDVGNSGTTLYFLTSVFGLGETEMTLTGDEQILNRPIGPLVRILQEFGVRCAYQGKSGFPPLTIQGPLTGGIASIECKTSQYLSGLLLAAPLSRQEVTIKVPLLYEKPYITMTLRWLDANSINYTCDSEYTHFFIKGRQSYRNIHSHIPGDFSSASFFFCAAALTDSNLEVENLTLKDTQGDKQVLDVLQRMGCSVDITDNGAIQIRREGALKGTTVDLNSMPDALPALSVTACFAEGRTVLKNVAQARLKETDRIKVMCQELKKIGAKIEELPDGLIIEGQGGRNLHQAEIKGHGDHRVVMAFAIAALGIDGGLTIEGAEAVEITFPRFFTLLKQLIDRSTQNAIIRFKE